MVVVTYQVSQPKVILEGQNLIFSQLKLKYIHINTIAATQMDRCVCPCASVTRSDDGGRNTTTSQHTTIPPPIGYSLFLRFYKGIMSEKESSQLVAGS